MFWNRQQVSGIVRCGNKTKELIKVINPGEIAWINHDDLDPVAAAALIESKVRAVINTGKTLTGRYPNPGPEMLLKEGIPLFETEVKKVADGARVKIMDQIVYINGVPEGFCRPLTKLEIRQINAAAEKRLDPCLEAFIENTMAYALKEKSLVMGSIQLPALKIRLKGRPVLVVTRGRTYKEDLAAIRPYIREVKPVLIGVDGGADALLESGFKPHLIVGDMDSVSNSGLTSGSQLIVHAYPGGNAPGMKRLQEMGLKGETVSCPGTSEDLALLLAYQSGAELIVTVGSHSSMIDFLEKGRPGMGSTFLVRLKVGEKLVDAKGVSQLYRRSMPVSTLLLLLLSAMFPGALLLSLSPAVSHVFHLLLLRVSLMF